jgi:hypothetical protein
LRPVMHAFWPEATVSATRISKCRAIFKAEGAKQARLRRVPIL